MPISRMRRRPILFRWMLRMRCTFSAGRTINLSISLSINRSVNISINNLCLWQAASRCGNKADGHENITFESGTHRVSSSPILLRSRVCLRNRRQPVRTTVWRFPLGHDRWNKWADTSTWRLHQRLHHRLTSLEDITAILTPVVSRQKFRLPWTTAQISSIFCTGTWIGVCFEISSDLIVNVNYVEN